MNKALPIISITLSGSSAENMALQLDNIALAITVMRGGTLKLVKMQEENAPNPMFSTSSWR